MTRADACKAGIAALLAMAALPAVAAIPPINQRLGEFQSVVELRDLATSLGIPIDRIEMIGPRLYRVTAGRCHVDVRMVPVHGGPGEGLAPPRLEARPERRVCGP
jgi:hypothetical protein